MDQRRTFSACNRGRQRGELRPMAFGNVRRLVSVEATLWTAFAIVVDHRDGIAGAVSSAGDRNNFCLLLACRSVGSVLLSST